MKKYLNLGIEILNIRKKSQIAPPYPTDFRVFLGTFGPEMKVQTDQWGD